MTLPILQQAPPGTGLETAWTQTTPTVTSAVGTLTTASSVVKTKQVGKAVFVNIVITITNNGTGSNAILVTLPVAPLNNTYIGGIDRGLSLKAVSGRMVAGSGAMAIYLYDSTYPVGTGSELVMDGTYESA